MYVQLQGDLCFLAHPRTASRAMRDALKAIDFHPVGKHHAGPPNHSVPPRTAFCVVRNHWDAVISWYFNGNRDGDGPHRAWLDNFISKHPAYFKPEGLWWFLYIEPKPRILRYETLQTDLDALFDEFGVPRVTLDVVGKSPGRKDRHYREFYDASLAARIRDHWGHEIDRLGYSF